MGIRRAIGCALALSAATAVAACGGGEERANRARPPSPVNVTAAIIDGRVLVSPRTVGAGPIRLIVTNQSGAPQSVTLETKDVTAGPGITATTAPIGPRATATLAAEVAEGAYAVRTGDRAIKAGALRVGARRPSAQDDLLLP